MDEPSTDGGDSGRRDLRHYLAFRLAVALGLGVAAVFVLAGFLNIGLQREHMTTLVGDSAERVADTILGSTRDAMLRNNPEDLFRILESIGRQQGIDRVRIFDKEGHIRHSTRAEEVGRVVDKKAEQCTACHAAEAPLSHLDRPDRLRIFEVPDQGRVLGIIAPIRNEPDCTRTCHAHSAELKILGVLDVQLSLRGVDQQILDSEKQLGLGLLLTVVAVLALGGFLLWRLVLRPVHKLTVAMVKVRTGDLSTRVPVTSSDEIGVMATSWNKMLEDLGDARRALEEWGRTLEVRVDEKTKALETAHKRMVVVEKMASLGKLAAVMAHELNNPLTGISTYARLLRKKLDRLPATAGGDEHETGKILQMVEEEATRCANIVRNLLLFSRTPGARFTTGHIRPLIDRCVMLVKHQAELQEVEIVVGVAPDLPAFTLDESQIQEMLLVLVMNAVEAMPKGGRLTITAFRDPAADQVTIKVADTGGGILPEHMDKIFEPFFTTKEEGKGIGLGLSIAYGIANRHHGSIEVDSTVGMGSVFTVRLPLRQPAPAEDAPTGP